MTLGSQGKYKKALLQFLADNMDYADYMRGIDNLTHDQLTVLVEKVLCKIKAQATNTGTVKEIIEKNFPTKVGTGNGEYSPKVQSTIEGLSLTEIAGTAKSNDVYNKFVGRVTKDAIFVTDDHHSYKLFIRKEQIQHVKVAGGTYVNGAFSLSRVNSLHSAIDRSVIYWWCNYVFYWQIVP